MFDPRLRIDFLRIVYYLVVTMMLLCPVFVNCADDKPLATVLFTGNGAGAIKDCGCGDDPAGGLARRKSVIDSLRKIYPEAILVDSGDFLSSYQRQQNDNLYLAMLSTLQYDALTLGEYEFTYGNTFLQNAIHAFLLKLISANVYFRDHPIAFVIASRPSVRIGIVGVADPAVFEFLEPQQLPSWQEAWQEPLAEAIRTVTTQSDLIVGLVHGNPEMLEAAASYFPEGSLLVGGHWHRLFLPERDGVRVIAGRTIVNPGTAGEYVGVARLDKKGGQWHTELIRLDHTIRPDAGLEQSAIRVLQASKRRFKLN